MIGISDREYAALRFEAFNDDVLRPAVYPLAVPLEVGVFQTDEPISLARARKGDYQRVERGFRWGPVWSTAWFRLQGVVPEEMEGKRLALRFSSGTEALLWQGGAPRQGFDENRELCLLAEKATAGEALDLFVEAACNMPLGISTFWWDAPELRKRWLEEKPGRLEHCELVAIDRTAQRVVNKLDFARRLALALPEGSPRSLELLRALRELVESIPSSDPTTGLAASEARLDDLLRGDERAPDTTCTAVGHAHLDTAWLWTLRETRRKALRSWANALELMERHDSFCFIASQAQQYAWCEEDSPALFERIRERVAEGRWEAAGAMWVEPDCHAPSGESLVRQILVGTRWWREHFGESARQSFLFLPDTFGFPACLPQIMRGAGLATFVTDKMAWSERNEFPWVTFRWRGLDGSEVLAHLTPGTNYNSPVQPADLLRGEQRLQRLDGGPVGEHRQYLRRWLQPFGYGDGGGGPTEETVRRAELAAHTAGLPRVELGRVDEFCAGLHAARERELTRSGRDLPAWDGELYLEQHRGTYTTHAWLKAANARAEERLRAIEALLASEGVAPDEESAARLDAAWKTVLLHQFHDILPGSSIHEVYVEARATYAKLEDELDALLEEAAARLVPAGETALLNPTSHRRDEAVVELGEGELRLVRDLPALGLCALVEADVAPAYPVVTTERLLSNGLVELELDRAGRIARLQCVGTARPVNAVGAEGALLPLNQLVLYRDRPRRWEAWNLDEDYTDVAKPLDGTAESIEVIEGGPLRGIVECRRDFGEGSTLVQRYVLRAGERRVEVETTVDWHEDRRLLRALFPTAIRASHWTCGTQFGHLERRTHKNDPWDLARFEVPGRRWMDLSQPGLGLAVLDHGIVGRSGVGGTLGVSLLRAPTFPDPEADRGENRFRYALLPHAGDWRAAGVPREADELAEPLLVVAGAADEDETAPASIRPPAFTLEVAAPGDVEVACFKPATDGRGAILRLVERHGAHSRVRIDWRVPPKALAGIDLLERPHPRELGQDGGGTTLTLAPFEIVTLRVEHE